MDHFHAGPSTSHFLRRTAAYPPAWQQDLLQATNFTKRQTQEAAAERHSAADFYIPSLPGQSKTSRLTQFAGHLPFYPKSSPAGDSEAHGFFYLVKARHIATSPALVVWFNGGPGCSSFDGAMMEVGPLRMILKGDGKLKDADSPWNEYANMLFIDQPVGTGYSYGNTKDYVHELDQMANQVVNLLEWFYSVFPEYERMDTYLAGESYAGQYIPYIADAIFQTSLISPPLQGLLIGNGWIDPKAQYLSYHEFAFSAGLLTPDSNAGKKLMKAVDNCNKTLNAMLENGDEIPVHIGQCETVLSTITDSTIQSINQQKMCLNMYDVRLVDTWPACGMNWPPDLADLTPYLDRQDVKDAFHATAKPESWVECNGHVGANFWARNSKPAIKLFPSLLEKVKILLFSGDQDLICCHTGTERLIRELEWNGHTGWTNSSKTKEWEVDGIPAGTWREERNLTYVKIANASHMAPYDVPVAASDMLLRFMGLNFLEAAGPASTVPSRIGSETESILAPISSNSTLNTAKTESNDVSSSDSTSSTGSIPADSTPEHFYNAESAGIIVILLASAIGLFICYRKRLRKAGTGDYGRVSGIEAGLAGMGGGGGVGKASSSSIPRHRRQSSVKGVTLPDDGPHELDELVVDGDYRDATTGARSKRNQSKVTGGGVREHATVFALDDEDDEDLDRK